jgi:hypothetical protein
MSTSRGPQRSRTVCRRSRPPPGSREARLATTFTRRAWFQPTTACRRVSPSWSGGAPAALDLAVTSPQRLDVLSHSSQHVGAAAAAYEAFKRNHLNTAAECASQGLSFIPMIAEPSGGWGPSGICTLKAFARAAAIHSTSGAEPSAILAERLQRLCAAIRRASARAILRRSVVPESNFTNPRQAALAVLSSAPG